MMTLTSLIRNVKQNCKKFDMEGLESNDSGDEMLTSYYSFLPDQFHLRCWILQCFCCIKITLHFVTILLIPRCKMKMTYLIIITFNLARCLSQTHNVDDTKLKLVTSFFLKFSCISLTAAAVLQSNVYNNNLNDSRSSKASKQQNLDSTGFLLVLN